MTLDKIQAAGDPQIGNLATPINASSLVQNWLKGLPLYRPGLPPNKRGLEIGMAHGYFVYGPFALLGPMRDSGNGDVAGLLSAAGLVAILTIALSLYGKVQSASDAGITTSPELPTELKTTAGWSAFTNSFMIGGLGGAFVAFAVHQMLGFLPF